ncbi:hypothetical protein BWQ96_03251 [Gracilariopsis chorda]|uniref:Uncharacterized protein n=1 Tax=Gracilariopsis chorda TaxID=448386 RepID=A0A2V3IXX2_9FLOR|nr:hypothetical protein BWQ96_03251 [Gracilariopsis chorda]|eukprot:PXF46913.1 hypothetical protein BWQ96_03251 [Gracilariopsis chorda]
MALPSKLGAFMVGLAVGSANCFYWLYHDVNNVNNAMTRKIDSIQHQIEEKERKAKLQLAALEAAIPSLAQLKSDEANPAS